MLSFCKDIYLYRELLFALVRREISVRYRQSVLGPLWAVLQPLTFMVIFMCVHLFLRIPSDGVPYPIFVFAALLPWTSFSNAVISATPSIVTNAHLITKVYFPRETLPISVAVVSVLDFVVGIILYFCLMVFYGIYPGLNVLYIPILFCLQLILAISLALLFAVLGAYRRDAIRIAQILMMFWMYLSPIFYSVNSVPEKYRLLYMLNPMAQIIDSYRMILLINSHPDFKYMGGCAILIFLFLMLSVFIFRKLDAFIADVV